MFILKSSRSLLPACRQAGVGARDDIVLQCQFSTVAWFLKLSYNGFMVKGKIIIKISHSKRRIPRELREAAFKRKAGPIKRRVKRESGQKLLKGLDSLI